MLPAKIGYGALSLPTFGLFAVLAFLAGSFFLWRRLREDYPEEEILTFTLWAALAALGGGRILYWFDHFWDFGFDLGKWFLFVRYPGFSFVGSFLLVFLLAFWWAKKKSWDLWLMGDRLTQVFLLVLVILGTGLFLEQGSFFPKVLLAIFVLILSFFLQRRFRQFIWYRSGKPGFVACSVSALYFLGNLVLDFWAQVGLYWEKAAALTIVLGALVFLYRRSERVLVSDFGQITSFVKSRFQKQ